jgi:ATP-dependent DNA helicase RecG
MGTQQSGILEFKIADLVKDQQILTDARRLAIRIIEADPELENINNKKLKYAVENLEKQNSDWSRIG